MTPKIFHRVCPDSQLRTHSAESNKNGWLEGYLAVFGNVDHGGDRIMKGAFAKSIAERVPAKRVPLMVRHFAYGGDTSDVVGVISEAKEDQYGLWIHADFSSTQQAQDLRTQVSEGMVWGLSVGYELLRWENVQDPMTKDSIMNLLECKLVEGTVTVRPMNEAAVITAAKSLQQELVAEGSTSSPELLTRLNALLSVLEAKASQGDTTDSQIIVPGSATELQKAKVRLEAQRRLITLLNLED